jgi:4-hydroxy-tetrahydrodipicolinate synthase
MSGDDDLTFKMMTDPRIKAGGVISVMSNIAPAAIREMTQRASQGDASGAEKLKTALEPLFGVVVVKVDSKRQLNGQSVEVSDRFRNPLPVKTMMRILGMPSGPCRQPLGKMSKDGLTALRAALNSVWNNNPQILQPIQDFYGADIAGRINDDALWNSVAY